MTSTDKIKSLDELSVILESLRTECKRIVHCHGVFDLMHIGHIRHFEQARKMGDVLVVTLTQDCHVNKGPHRPVFGEDLRAETIASLECVDFVAINRWPSAVETIRVLKPDLYVKGSDYRVAELDRTGGIGREAEAVKQVGGKLTFTDDITFSSSNLINRYMQPFSPEVNAYLSEFRNRHTPEEVIGHLDRIKDLRILVIGETIIDEYSYCRAIGKSSKEPILVVRHINTEKFAGGVLAVANHVANFSDHVTLVTMLGQQNPQREFVEEHLNPKIERVLLTQHDAPTIVKRRFVDDYFFQKNLEVYEMSDAMLNPADDERLRATLEQTLEDFDLVIVSDFGHGMISDACVELLCRRAPFLAVNTQANAGNMGYHTISKYPRADYICIANNEIQLEKRDRNCDASAAILEISAKLNAAQMTITQGKHGCLCYRREDGVIRTPALAGNVVDRIGAGDALLSVTAPCAYLQVPADVLGFIGNAVGAQAVATVCNRAAVDKISLVRQIESLLK